MSLCRLSNIQFLEYRTVWLRWLPRERCKVKFVTRAEGRSPTRRRRNQSSTPEDGREDDGEELQGNIFWDSNAEGVRRNRTPSRNRIDGRAPSSQISQTSPGWSLPKKEWDYDFESDKKPNEQWQWWQMSSDDDEYDDELEEEEEEENGFDMRTLLQDQLFSSLRWGLPASLFVLPWLLGNPVILMIGLAAIPTVQKAVGPVVNEVWQAFLDFSGYPPPRQRRKGQSVNTTQSSSDEREEPYSGWGGGSDNGQPYRYTKSSRSGNNSTSTPAEGFPYKDLDSDFERFSQEVRLPSPIVSKGAQQQSRDLRRVVNMGGWDDLEADRRRRMPVRKAKRPSKLGRRNSRTEQPLFLRLLVALFPFLRNWGGWLSVLLLFPSLAVLESIDNTLAVS